MTPKITGRHALTQRGFKPLDITTKSTRGKFTPPVRQRGGIFQARKVLPGSLVNRENIRNFLTNVGAVVAGVPEGISAGIYWQPDANRPSNLVLLNFSGNSCGLFGMEPPQKLLLHIRVSGFCSEENLGRILKVFTDLLSNHNFLKRDSYSEGAEKSVEYYINKLSQIKNIGTQTEEIL